LAVLLAGDAAIVLGVRAQPHSGALLYLNRGGIWRLNLETEERQPFLQLSSGTITHVSHSSDRTRIAYSTDIRGAGLDRVASEIVVATARGNDPRVIVREERTGATVEWPSWSPDGMRLSYAKTPFGSRTQRIEEVDVATGARNLVADAGSSPSYSPDGETIVFAAPVGQTWSISTVARQGGEPALVVPATGFEDLDHPLFAPIGEYIVFLAATSVPESPVSRATSSQSRLIGRAPATHPGSDANFDLWAVRLDGTELRKVADLFSQQPYLAWSPDGQSIAARDRLGLRVVDVATEPHDGAGARWVSGLVGSGPISWGW